MAEYDARTINIGAEYSFWKDYINAVIELNRCKYFSGGIYSMIHLNDKINYSIRNSRLDFVSYA